ncbi:hypothetical protein [Streptomyces sp. SM12]|uniref:hypothetical protein n=1 Tax=Streptomyces sp. SM12 TaxID=1071602 RepID=UPI000CD55B1E|nr:hypothetical protein [Streptomyces sp. SM12]
MISPAGTGGQVRVQVRAPGAAALAMRPGRSRHSRCAASTPSASASASVSSTRRQASRSPGTLRGSRSTPPIEMAGRAPAVRTTVALYWRGSLPFSLDSIQQPKTAGHLVVWSDGAVHTRAEVYQPDAPHIGGQWAPQVQRLHVTRELLLACTRAENWPALQAARVWEAWLDAEAIDSAVVHTSTSLAYGAERTITLTRHTITIPGGKQSEVWETAVALNGVVGDQPREHTLHTVEPAARAALGLADDGLPPVMTIAEMAPHLGTTTEALRKALRRERRKQYEPDDVARHAVTARAEPGWRGRVGGRYTDPETPDSPRAPHLYDPRVVRKWWHSRPGHGPGRGHRRVS